MRQLVSVSGLTVHYSRADGTEIPAVNNVSFEIAVGEVLGLVGESGCGKSTLALSLLRLMPGAGRILGGSILFRGLDLLKLDENRLQKVRGAEISMIPQEPAITLNPVLRVGDQIAEVVRAHMPWSRERSRQEAMVILEEAGLANANRIYAAYPHQLSGGQRQRVVIGQAIACRPALIIADEPTTALDLALQADILLLFKRLKDRLHTAFLLISHDPLIFANLADRVMVMYAGRIVEEGLGDKIFKNALHPYTQGLLRCLSGISGKNKSIRKEPLPVIPGSPPDPVNLPYGCSFNPRCAEKMDVCVTRPPERVEAEAMHSVRCFIYGG